MANPHILLILGIAVYQRKTTATEANQVMYIIYVHYLDHNIVLVQCVWLVY